MKSKLKIFALIVWACFLTVANFESFAANGIIGSWKADEIARLSSENINLRDSRQHTVAVVSRARVVRLIDVVSRLQVSSGLSAELLVVQFQDGRPNAFATAKNGRNIVGITPSMFDLIGDDLDAYAAIFGHELAHLVKQHGAESAARQAFLQGLGSIAALVIGARIRINVGMVADLGVDMINKIDSSDFRMGHGSRV